MVAVCFDFGKRLLDAMRRDGGWHCEAGPSSFYRWWNRRPNVAGNRLAEGKSGLTGLLGGPARSEKE